MMIMMVMMMMIIIINTRNSPYVECENNGDTSNNWSDWHHFEMV